MSLPPKRPTKLPCSRDSECPQPQLQSCLWVLQYPPVENHTWLEKPPELNGMGHLQKPLIKEVHLTFLSWKIMENHGISWKIRSSLAFQQGIRPPPGPRPTLHQSIGLVDEENTTKSFLRKCGGFGSSGTSHLLYWMIHGTSPLIERTYHLYI